MNMAQSITESTTARIILSVVAGIVYAVPAVLALILAILAIRALVKYLRSGDVRREKTIIRRSLSESLKENRIRCKMTQEFVAEALGVSRQAVSKWETGASDPSTANLCELAKLYGVPAGELLLAASGVLREPDDESEGGKGL